MIPSFEFPKWIYHGKSRISNNIERYRFTSWDSWTCQISGGHVFSNDFVTTRDWGERNQWMVLLWLPRCFGTSVLICLDTQWICSWCAIDCYSPPGVLWCQDGRFQQRHGMARHNWCNFCSVATWEEQQSERERMHVVASETRKNFQQPPGFGSTSWKRNRPSIVFVF